MYCTLQDKNEIMIIWSRIFQTLRRVAVRLPLRSLRLCRLPLGWEKWNVSNNYLKIILKYFYQLKAIVFFVHQNPNWIEPAMVLFKSCKLPKKNKLFPNII